MDAPHRLALAEQLLLDQQLSRAAVDDRWSRCRAPGYWTDLAPGTSIGVRPSALDEVPIDRAALGVAAEQMLVDGYCGVPPFLAPEAIAIVNAAIDVVMAEGWPPVFAWVFDQLWASVRTAAVGRLLDAGLGASARQVPHLWVHVVRAVVGARGWSPHMDGGLARGSRRRLSIWIALTEARVDNGCMYLLPRSQAPAGSVDFD